MKELSLTMIEPSPARLIARPARAEFAYELKAALDLDAGYPAIRWEPNDPDFDDHCSECIAAAARFLGGEA